MDARGEARTPGHLVSCDIMRKPDGWFLSLVIACEPHRECGDLEAGLDWGVETFATVAYAPGEYGAFENDRLLNAETEALKTEQRQLSNALGGKRSKRAKKARKALAPQGREPPQEPRSPGHGQVGASASPDCYRGPVDREHDRLREADGREARQERQGESRIKPCDPGYCTRVVPQCPAHQSGTSWVPGHLVGPA